MKNALKRWIGRVPDIGEVVKRFPVPVGLMGIFTLIIVFIEHINNDDRWAYLLGGLVLAAYLLVFWTIGREGQKKPKFILTQILFAAVIVVAAWFAQDIYFGLPMAIAGIILLLGNSVRWRRSRDDLHVWDFTHKLWTGVVFAVVGSVIYLLGVLAIMFALKSLFGLDIEWLMEKVLLPVGLGFLAPLYWMSTLPQVDEDYQELHDNPGFVSKAVAFLGTWLLAPLILVYAAILLAYGVKIILAGSMPKGEVALLTTPFLIIGTLTWLVLEPPFIQKKWLARIFRKIWFWLSIPVSILLALAIFIRVQAYGLTEERILLIMGTIWALGVGIWFSIRKQDSRDIRIIPGLAGVLLLIASVTAPFLSVINQDSRFTKNMETAGVISAEGKFSPETEIADNDAAKKAKGALQYLFRKKEHDRVEAQLEKWGVEYEGRDQFEAYKLLGLDDIKIRYDGSTSIRFERHNEGVLIADYEYLHGPYHFNLATTDKKMNIVTFQNVKLSSQRDMLILEIDGTEQTRFDVGKWIKELPVMNDEYQVDNPVITIFDEPGRELALHIKSINKWNDQRATFQVFVLTKGIISKP